MEKSQQKYLILVALMVLEAATIAFAFPQPQPEPYSLKVKRESGVAPSIPLLRRAPSPKTKEEWGAWAHAHRQGLKAKYGGSAEEKSQGKHERRSNGTNM